MRFYTQVLWALAALIAAAIVVQTLTSCLPLRRHTQKAICGPKGFGAWVGPGERVNCAPGPAGAFLAPSDAGGWQWVWWE
jgi:hypothetical protein